MTNLGVKLHATVSALSASLASQAVEGVDHWRDLGEKTDLHVFNHEGDPDAGRYEVRVSVTIEKCEGDANADR